MSRKADFVERDREINEIVIREGRPTSRRNINEFEIESGVEEALKRLRQKGSSLLVVTNQPEMARGLLMLESLEMMTERIVTTPAADEVRICLDDNGDGCRCRKPRPRMPVELERERDLTLNYS